VGSFEHTMRTSSLLLRWLKPVQERTLKRPAPEVEKRVTGPKGPAYTRFARKPPEGG
jgi:hypothetical protein